MVWLLRPRPLRFPERPVLRRHPYLRTVQQLLDGENLDAWVVPTPTRRVIETCADRLLSHVASRLHRGFLPKDCGLSKCHYSQAPILQDTHSLEECSANFALTAFSLLDQEQAGRKDRGVAALALLLALIHRSAWKGNSQKFAAYWALERSGYLMPR
jgi:hypothetical protein